MHSGKATKTRKMISTKFRVIVSWRVGRVGEWVNAMREKTTRSFEATGNVPFFTLLLLFAFGCVCVFEVASVVSHSFATP